MGGHKWKPFYPGGSVNRHATKEQIYNLADMYMKEKRFEEAIVLYEELMEMNPGEESIIMSLAWAYEESGMRDRAVDCLEKLLKTELKRKVFTGFAFDELVRIFKEEGWHDRLIDICERAVACQPEDIGLLNTLGNAYLTAGETEKAVEVFENVTHMDPDFSVSFMNLGNALIACGDFDGAEKSYDKAIAIDPSEAASFCNRLGEAYYKTGQYGRAEKAFRKALKHRPDNRFYHCNLGDVLVKQEKLEDANTAYENAVRLAPQSQGSLYNRLGNLLATEHYHLEAIGAFRKAIAADPRNPFYYLRLAESCMAENLVEMAKEILQQVKQLGHFEISESE